MSDRITGVVTSWHASADKYGGSYGEIQTENGKTYTWNAGNVFRNYSRCAVGAHVSFAPVGFGYATDIDQTDKESK